MSEYYKKCLFSSVYYLGKTDWKDAARYYCGMEPKRDSRGYMIGIKEDGKNEWRKDGDWFSEKTTAKEHCPGFMKVIPSTGDRCIDRTRLWSQDLRNIFCIFQFEEIRFSLRKQSQKHWTKNGCRQSPKGLLRPSLPSSF